MNCELQFREWLPVLDDKLTFILLNIKEKRDLNEDDWSVLEFFHKIYWLGEMPICRPNSKMNDKTTK